MVANLNFQEVDTNRRCQDAVRAARARLARTAWPQPGAEQPQPSPLGLDRRAAWVAAARGLPDLRHVAVLGRVPAVSKRQGV